MPDTDRMLHLTPARIVKSMAWLSAAFILPGVAYADMVWPALIVTRQLVSAPVIALSLVLEAFTLWRFFGLTLPRSLWVSLVVNLVSALVGLALLPLSGVIWEFFPILTFNALGLWTLSTFNPLTWAMTFPIAVLITSCIELASLRRFYGLAADRRQKAAWVIANMLTIALALYAALSGTITA